MITMTIWSDSVKQRSHVATAIVIAVLLIGKINVSHSNYSLLCNLPSVRDIMAIDHWLIWWQKTR